MDRRVRLQAAVLIGLLTAAFILILFTGDLFVRLRLQLNDIYFLPARASDQIVLIAIDDASLAAYGRTPVEWSRSIFADLVTILGDAGARIVAFDILFAQATPEDDVFAAAMQAARQSEARTRFLMPIVGVERGGDEAHEIHFDQVLQPTPALASVVDYLGFVNVFGDADNKVRRQPSLIHAGSAQGFAFSITTFLAYLRIPAAAFPQIITWDDSALTIAGEHRLPIDDNGLWRQNFFAPIADESGLTTVSLRDVIERTVDPTLFADKIAMIGLMNSVNAPDERATPLNPSMAGVEIHAHAVETLLQNSPLTEQSRLSQASLIVALALFASLIYTRLHWRWMIVAAVSISLGLVIGAFVIFALRRDVIHLFYPLLTLAVALIGSIGWQITSETNRRRSAEQLLATIQRQKDLLEAILRGSPTGIVVVDKQGKLINANRAFAEALGIETTAITDKPLQTVINTAGLSDEARVKLTDSLAKFEPFRTEIKHGGKTLGVNAATMSGDDRWVIVFHDVSALAELSEIKTHMIRMVSHDLKNPLASVLGFSSLLLDTPIGDGLSDNQKRMMDQMRRASNSMLQIINETLSMEQLRSGRMRKKPVMLEEQIREAMKPYQLEAEQRHQQVKVETSVFVPPVLGDAFQLTQAIGNLISNAVKYTPDGGMITVRLTQVEERALIIIEDTGYGISDEAQTGLFQEFYRVDLTSHIKGTGLGLSLVKAIIEAHDGKVSVNSKVNEGSTFTIELPLAAEESLL